MVLSSKTFHIFKSINRSGGIARFYSSWVISKSLLEELSASAASAPSSGHPQARPPCLMLPAVRDKSTGDMVYRFFNPINKKTFKIMKRTDSSPLPNTARCFWSSHGWLAFIDPRDCGLYLTDPFSDVVIRLPSIQTFPTVVGTIRKSNNIRFILRSRWESYSYPLSPRYASKTIIDEVVSSSASAFDKNHNDCLLMAMGGQDLLFCKPGDTAWTALSGPLHPYKHIIPSSIKDKVFYAMGHYGQIEAWDLRDLSCIKRTVIDYKRSLCEPKFCELEADLRSQICRTDQKRYLVESSGDLLLVYRYVAVKGVAEDGTIRKDGFLAHIPHKTLRFDVYKMDSSLQRWTYVNSLGDRALFVGLSNSISLHVRDCPGLRPNSIYFADDCWRTGIVGYLNVGHDMGVYNLEDSSIEPFYPFGNLRRRIIPSPFWVAPNPLGGNAVEWFA